MIKRLKDFEATLEKLRKSGIVRGELTGFNCLDQLYTVKQGSYTIILGSPTHGKSEFIFELLLNQSIKFGKRHLIYSPETGSVEEIFAELIHKFTRKDFYTWLTMGRDEKEYQKAKEWLDYHFLIVDSDERAYTLIELFAFADKYEKEHPNEDKISCIMAEPYNEIKHEMTAEFGTRQDLYIENLMGEARRYCKKNKKHLFLSIHPTDQPIVQTKDGNYYPCPLPRQAAGGQALYRKAMAWITIWRPPTFLEENGIPYQDNETVVNIDKAKPKRVCVKGSCRLFLDWKEANRYYEYFEGKQCFAFDHEKSAIERAKAISVPNNKVIQPSISFNEPVKEREAPF